MEKRKLFHVLLKQFVEVHNKWEPIIIGDHTDSTLSAVSVVEHSFQPSDTVVGCFAGHPSELIITLIDEIIQMTAIVTDCKLIVFCYSSLYLYVFKKSCYYLE